MSSAADALLQSLTYYHGGQTNTVLFRTAYRNYGQAIRWLRTSLLACPSHDTLVTVSLLVMFELTMNRASRTARRRDLSSHWSGISALLLSLPLARLQDDIVRAIFYSMWEAASVLYVARGVPSPYDSETWLDILPLGGPEASSEAGCLRRASNRMLIKIPSLVAELRRLRARPDVKGSRVRGDDQCCSSSANDVIPLAAHLSALREDAAETRLLRRVKILPTTDPMTAAIVPHALHFTSIDDFSATIMYWSARLTVINPCLKLADLTSDTNLDLSDLRTEHARHTTNLLMAWQYATQLGPFATAWVVKALLHTWAMLRTAREFRGVPGEMVRVWLLPKLNHPFVEWAVPTAEEASESMLDGMADLIVGGDVGLLEWYGMG